MRILLFGMLRNTGWLEFAAPNRWYDNEGQHRVAGRVALTLGLTAVTAGRSSLLLVG